MARSIHAEIVGRGGPALYRLAVGAICVWAKAVGAATSPLRTGSLIGTAVAILHAALRRAANQPVLQALTCFITANCLAVAALTWRAVGVRAMLGFAPVGAAGQCGASLVF